MSALEQAKSFTPRKPRTAAWGQPAAERRHRRTCEGAADSRRQLPLPARARPFDRGELAGVGADGAEPTRRPAPDAYCARVGVERPVVAFDPGIDVVLHAVRDRDHRFAATARWTWRRKCEDYRGDESSHVPV